MNDSFGKLIKTDSVVCIGSVFYLISIRLLLVKPGTSGRLRQNEAQADACARLRHKRGRLRQMEGAVFNGGKPPGCFILTWDIWTTV